MLKYDSWWWYMSSGPIFGVDGRLYMLFDGGTYTNSTSFGVLALPSDIDVKLLPTPIVFKIVGAIGAMVTRSRSAEPCRTSGGRARMAAADDCGEVLRGSWASAPARGDWRDREEDEDRDREEDVRISKTSSSSSSESDPIPARSPT